MDYVAIDFETANEQRSSACAIGLVIVRYGEVARRISCLIRPPELRFSYWNVRVHGIRPEQVANESRFDQIWPVLRPYLEGATLIAHNAPFDMSVLRGVLDEYGLEYPDASYYCTVAISRRIWPHLTSHRLDSVAGWLGIQFKHHDALEDAGAAAEIARRACIEQGAATFHDLTRGLGLSPGRLMHCPDPRSRVSG